MRLSFVEVAQVKYIIMTLKTGSLSPFGISLMMLSTITDVESLLIRIMYITLCYSPRQWT